MRSSAKVSSGRRTSGWVVEDPRLALDDRLRRGSGTDGGRFYYGTRRGSMSSVSMNQRKRDLRSGKDAMRAVVCRVDIGGKVGGLRDL